LAKKKTLFLIYVWIGGAYATNDFEWMHYSAPHLLWIA